MNLGQLWYRHEGGDTAPFDHVHCRQGRRGRSPHTRLPDTKAQALRPAAHGAFAIFENGERPRFIQLEHLHKTFALELIKNVLTNYHKLFCKVTRCASPSLYLSETYMPTVVLKSFSCPQHSELLLLLQHHLIRLDPQNALPALRFPSTAPKLFSSCSSNSPPSSRRRPSHPHTTYQTHS